MLQPRDRNAVSGQIAALDQSIFNLGAVESKLSGELNEVRARIEELRNQRAALESRIAVVWSLPNEILAYIFELGVIDEEDEVTTPDNGEGDDHVEPLSFNVLVSHVCQAFREIAIHTPSLWSKIHIFDLEPPRLHFVRECVERSGCSGLDIVINRDDGHFDSDSDPIRLLMEILVPHLHRFKRLAVRLCGFQALYLVMQHLNKPAPQLEVLELSDVDYESAFDEEDPFEPLALREPLTLFGGVMPKLEGVSLDGAHVAWAKCNFTGLTDLHLGYHTRDVRPSYEEFKTIIDASPALHTLDLCGSAPLLSDETADSSNYPPLQMERLEDLHISDIPSDYATTLISLLNTPNVMSLSLTDLDTNDYSAFFRQIIGPPVLFPALTTLKLASIEVDDNAIEDFLRASSKVTHLGLYLNRMSTAWLTYLEPRGPENEVLCPKLECLRCVSASTYDLKKILEKRRDVGFPISTLQVDKETGSLEGKSFMQWIRENATVEIIEPSENGTDDDDMGSEWGTDEEDDFDGFPYFSMEGFSDEEEEDEDGEEEYGDAIGMELDGSDDSGVEE